MSHLENLIFEWYDWRGFVVKRNVKVGRLGHGGWAGELDIVAYHPQSRELVHVESSIDAHSWETRERRFSKKFACGKKYISKVFPWLDHGVRLRQIAVLVSRGKDRRKVGGGEIRTIDELIGEIKAAVTKEGLASSRAIAEQYGLLRTLQLALCGYYRVV